MCLDVFLWSAVTPSSGCTTLFLDTLRNQPIPTPVSYVCALMPLDANTLRMNISSRNQSVTIIPGLNTFFKVGRRGVSTWSELDFSHNCHQRPMVTMVLLLLYSPSRASDERRSETFLFSKPCNICSDYRAWISKLRNDFANTLNFRLGSSALFLLGTFLLTHVWYREL